MRMRGEICSAQRPSIGNFWDTGASGRYIEDVCIWKGDSLCVTGVCKDLVALLSARCFFDFDRCPSSPCSLFLFFPSVDLCFLEGPPSGCGDCGAISIDINRKLYFEYLWKSRQFKMSIGKS